MVPARRRNQFQKDPGYIAIPYVYDYPGIGTGYGVLGSLNNIGGSCADVMGTYITGDVNGEIIGFDAVHLIPERLILDAGGGYFDRASIQLYNQRGMESDPDDYTDAEFTNLSTLGTRLTSTFYDRRLEGFIAYYGGQIQLSALRDPDGELIAEAEDSPAEWTGTDVLGGRLDLTDDYQDPRRGVRVEPTLWWTPPQGNSANYIVFDTSISAYAPIGKRHTWAFNYLISDAYVLEEGETDPQKLANQEGLEYTELTDARERQYIDNMVTENTYGSANSLGGVSRLRSYPEDRYNGAHSQFFGTELRWNLMDEPTPFNFILAKDIRTALQLATFYEIGTVAEQREDLWSSTRDSYGVGVRIVTGSGFIYRLDLATGSEGFQPSIFFQYPWEL